jgi:hypothetical protein
MPRDYEVTIATEKNGNFTCPECNCKQYIDTTNFIPMNISSRGDCKAVFEYCEECAVEVLVIAREQKEDLSPRPFHL